MPFRAVLFDAYGTLFDVHSAIARAGTALGERAGPVSALWRAKQLEYSWTQTLMGVYEDFWSLTERGLDHALATHRIEDPALRAALLSAYMTLDAYPEAAAVLDALRARGLRVGVFTNGTRRMVDAAIAAAGLDGRFDAVVTVEPERRFKPTAAVYTHAASAVGAAPGEILFASSNRWDVAGAAKAGFTPVWINRAGAPDEYPAFPPACVGADLTAVLAKPA